MQNCTSNDDFHFPLNKNWISADQLSHIPLICFFYSKISLHIHFFFSKKYRSFIEKKKGKKIYNSIFYSKNSRKYFAIAVKCVKNNENRISFIKDIEITDEKAYTIHLALNNKIEKHAAIESSSGFEAMEQM